MVGELYFVIICIIYWWVCGIVIIWRLGFFFK